MQRKAARHKKKQELRQRWSEWRTVWMLVMFDLPVGTRAQRQAYARFRKDLLELGFTKLQFSVYARFLATQDRADRLVKAIEASLPAEGQVRIFMITGKQFEKHLVFIKTRRQAPETEPVQLELF